MLLLAGLLGALWWQLPTVLSWGLTQFLQQQGLARITVEVSDVGMSATVIKQLDVSYLEPDTELRMQLEQVRLEYSLSELVSGQAQSLLIDSITLKLDHQPNPQVSTSPTLPSIELLLAAFQAVDPTALPINTVQLPTILFSHNLASESLTSFDTIELTADLNKREDQLNTTLVFANGPALHWVSDAKDGWNIQLFDTPEQEPQLGIEPQPEQKPQPNQAPQSQLAIINGGLNQVGQSLAFKLEVNPRLAEHLPLFTALADHSIDLAQVMLSGTIAAAESGPGLAILSTLQISDLALENDRIETLDAQFDWQIAQTSVEDKQSQTPWQLDIEFDHRASLTNASVDDWQADNIELSASGDLGLTEGVSKITTPDLLVSVDKLRQANELELRETSFSGAASITIDAQQWQLELADAWQLSSQYARLDETELPQGVSLGSAEATRVINTFNTAAEAQADIENGGDRLLIEKTSLRIKTPLVQNTTAPQGVREVDMALQVDQAHFNNGKWLVNGSLSIPQLTLFDHSSEPLATSNSDAKHQDLQNAVTDLPLSNVKQSFEFANNVLTSRGSLDSIERDLHITTTTKHKLKQQQGETAFDFKTIEFNNPERLNQLTSPAALAVNLVAGELKLSGKARWVRERGEWQTNVDVDTQLINLGGAYEETYFSGINIKSSLQVYPSISSSMVQRLSIAHIDAGVANTDTVLEFTLEPSKLGDLPVFNLLHAKTQLLQGSMSLKPGSYDLNRAKQTLYVILENINLSELVRLQQLEDIQATGLISGQLPILVLNGEVSIDNGQLQAIAPGGILRYQADADALKGNAYAETVVNALSNFNYEALRADTHYDSDGTLLLNLQLQGHNPDFEQGRQVNLNINLEQNVLKLFESVRLIDGVSDTLDKRVKDFYQRTTSP